MRMEGSKEGSQWKKWKKAGGEEEESLWLVRKGQRIIGHRVEVGGGATRGDDEGVRNKERLDQPEVPSPQTPPHPQQRRPRLSPPQTKPSAIGRP